MEQLTTKQAVATSKKGVQNQNETQLLVDYTDTATSEIYTLSLHDALPILGKVTVADVLAAQPVTTNLLKFMRASIKMIGVSNLQSFIASRTQKLTLSDISDESKNYLDKAGITTACLRIKSKWTAGGK